MFIWQVSVVYTTTLKVDAEAGSNIPHSPICGEMHHMQRKQQTAAAYQSYIKITTWQ